MKTMNNTCSFSGQFLALWLNRNIPVECPNCGSIQMPKLNRPFEADQFPIHPTLNGTTKPCTHWKRIDDLWQIVEGV
jgi:hypothetical protein